MQMLVIVIYQLGSFVCFSQGGEFGTAAFLIPALLFLTPVQNDPLSIARWAGPAYTCLGSKPRSTGEGVWSQHSYVPHLTPFPPLPPPLPCFHPNPDPSTAHPLSLPLNFLDSLSGRSSSLLSLSSGSRHATEKGNSKRY